MRRGASAGCAKPAQHVQRLSIARNASNTALSTASASSQKRRAAAPRSGRPVKISGIGPGATPARRTSARTAADGPPGGAADPPQRQGHSGSCSGGAAARPKRDEKARENLPTEQNYRFAAAVLYMEEQGKLLDFCNIFRIQKQSA